ncbi:two-component sensor histidine kinase, partial [Streptomyces sp. NPDC057557]
VGPPPPRVGAGSVGSGVTGLMGRGDRVPRLGATPAVAPPADGGFAVVADLPLTTDEAAEAAVQHEEAHR